MKIKAKFKASSVIILSLGAVGFSILAFSFLKPMFEHRYIQIANLSGFIFSIIVAVASLYYILKNEVITIEKNKLTQLWFFGCLKKEFSLFDLNSFTAIKKENKYLRWEDLDLYFKNGKVRITSSNVDLDSYYKIKEHLTKDLLENINEKVKWNNRNAWRFGAGLIIFWSLFSLIFINQDKKGDIIVDSSTTKSTYGLLGNDPKIKLSKRNNESIEIHLVEQPDFIFELNRPEFKALDVEGFLSSVKKGDQISLAVWQETYEKKIGQTNQLSFLDKHFSYHQIEILGITKNNIDFMPQELVNGYRSKFHTKENFYGLMTLALVGIGFGIYLIISSKEAR